MSGKHCPKCKQDIGVFAIFKAALPSRIKCPNCNTRVVYKPFPWTVTLITIIFYIGLLALILPVFYVVQDYFGDYKSLAALIFAFALWQPFDVFIAIYLRKKSELFERKI